jgi:predicted nucleotidyltransferase
MRYGLKDKYIDAIQKVLASFPEVEKVLLYGSRAKGTHWNGSDIDLSFIGDIDLSLLFKIEDELDDLLLPYKIDASILSTIENPDLVAHIHRVGVTLYEKTSKSTSN